MLDDHDVLNSDVFGTSVDHDVIYISHLADHDARTLAKGQLKQGSRFHLYLEDKPAQFVLVHYEGDTLLEYQRCKMIYPIQFGAVAGLDPTALDPDFAKHLIRVGFDSRLVVEPQYEKRVHPPVISSLKLPS